MNQNLFDDKPRLLQDHRSCFAIWHSSEEERKEFIARHDRYLKDLYQWITNRNNNQPISDVNTENNTGNDTGNVASGSDLNQQVATVPIARRTRNN